jgi:hypothetical protein
MPIIGLLGRSRVGKDTIADLIIKNYPQYQKVRLAAPIKAAVKDLYGWDDTHLETNLKEEIDPAFGVSPREAMVYITNSMKSFGGDDFFWRRFEDQYKRGLLGKNIIIPDVRYRNDVESISKLGGIIIKIERKNASVPLHAFESHIDNISYDVLITNDSTRRSLEEKIKEILKCFE